MFADSKHRPRAMTIAATGAIFKEVQSPELRSPVLCGRNDARGEKRGGASDTTANFIDVPQQIGRVLVDAIGAAAF
jgi:hypothetical protein